MKEIKKCLKTIENVIDSKISHANQGGCGIIAYYTILELEKRDIPFKIRISGASIKDGKFASCHHIWLNVGNSSFNRAGVNYGKTYPESFIAELRYSLQTKLSGNWNKSYDRKQNSKVKKIIKYHFEKYEKDKLHKRTFCKTSRLGSRLLIWGNKIQRIIRN
jgi:hypothetical protein